MTDSDRLEIIEALKKAAKYFRDKGKGESLTASLACFGAEEAYWKVATLLTNWPNLGDDVKQEVLDGLIF